MRRETNVMCNGFPYLPKNMEICKCRSAKKDGGSVIIYHLGRIVETEDHRKLKACKDNNLK